MTAFALSPAGRATARRAAYAIATNKSAVLNFNLKRFESVPSPDRSRDDPGKAWMAVMNVQKSSPLSTSGNRTIELRYERSFLLAAVAGNVMAAIALISWAILAPSETAMVFAIVGSPCALVVAVIRGRLALDREPVVVIDAVGLRDRRLALPVIPWARISSAEIENWVDAWFRPVRLRVGVRFHLDEEGEARSDPPFPSSVYIDLAKLDMNADVFVKHLHRFAPNLPIDRSLDNSVP